MMFNVFDFMSQLSESYVVDLQSEFKVNVAHYPDIEMV